MVIFVETWLNEQGITSLLSVPVLESAGYIMLSHTKKNWVVFTPKVKKLIFKRHTRVCNGRPYIDLRTNKAGLAMIETIHTNFESNAKIKKSEKAKLSHTVQSMSRHPSNKHYRQIVSLKDLKTCPIEVDDVTNCQSYFWSISTRFKGMEYTKNSKICEQQKDLYP